MSGATVVLAFLYLAVLYLTVALIWAGAMLPYNRDRAFVAFWAALWPASLGFALGMWLRQAVVGRRR